MDVDKGVLTADSKLKKCHSFPAIIAKDGICRIMKFTSTLYKRKYVNVIFISWHFTPKQCLTCLYDAPKLRVKILKLRHHRHCLFCVSFVYSKFMSSSQDIAEQRFNRTYVDTRQNMLRATTFLQSDYCDWAT